MFTEFDSWCILLVNGINSMLTVILKSVQAELTSSFKAINIVINTKQLHFLYACLWSGFLVISKSMFDIICFFMLIQLSGFQKKLNTNSKWMILQIVSAVLYAVKY